MAEVAGSSKSTCTVFRHVHKFVMSLSCRSMSTDLVRIIQGVTSDLSPGCNSLSADVVRTLISVTSDFSPSEL